VEFGRIAIDLVERTTSLSQHRNSGNLRAVALDLSGFGVAHRAEFNLVGLLFPWIFVVALLGFLAAWLVIAIMERTGLSRHVWHLPLFFLALVILLTSIIGLAWLP
jgi:hypothetical protein